MGRLFIYHESEVVTAFRNVNIEGGVSLGGFVESEDSFGVSEDILRSNEAVHGSLNAHKCGFSRNGSGGSLGVGELLASTNSSEGNVMRAEHTNCVFHLQGGCVHQRTVCADGSDRTVDDVIDLVALQRERFAETSSDFVLEHHSLHDGLSVDFGVLVSSSENSGVEIVVAEFTSSVLLFNINNNNNKFSK